MTTNLVLLCLLYLGTSDSLLGDLAELFGATKTQTNLIDKPREISDAVRQKFPAWYEDKEIREAEAFKHDQYIVHPIHSGNLPLEPLKPGEIDMSKYDAKETIYFIPPVPNLSIHDDVWKIADNITRPFKNISTRKYKEKVLILTPVHDSAKSLPKYQSQINNLTYPKHLLSIALGEDSSHDNTLNVSHKVIEEFRKSGIRRASVFHFNITGQIEGDWGERHSVLNQLTRRKHLAHARNLLLKHGLSNEDYVLWIDSDVGQLPPDLVQQLLWARKDVVAPSCLYRMGRRVRTYDKNTWRETELSLKEQKSLGANELVVEGYGPTTRIYLPDLRGEGRLVHLDGVGGCALMVRAECHRKGLEFPEKIYKNHIETEGLSKMAQTMGFSVYGLPFIEVFHV